jgi:PAS domain S-box-containing protein
MRAEEARIAAETLYRGLAEESLVGVYVLGQDGRFRYANPRMAEIFGYTREELVASKAAIDLIAAEDRARAAEYVRKRQDPTVKSIHESYRGVRKDGTAICVEVLGVAAELDGEPVEIGTLLDVSERKQAEEGLAARTKQLEAVRAVATEIARELDLDTLLGLIQRHAVDLAGGAGGAVWLLDEAAHLLIPHAWHSHGQWLQEVRLGLGEGVVGTVARRKEGLIVNDYRVSPYASPWILERTGITAVLAEPLLYRDRLVGVISVYHEDPSRRFTEGDREVLVLFAAQAAIAMENARLFQAEQARRRQVEAVRAVTEEVTRELDLGTVLGLIQRRAIELVGGVLGAVWLWDEGAEVLVPRAWEGYGEWMGELRLRLGEGITGAVAQRREGLIVNDYRTWPHAHGAALERTEITAALAEPLLYRNRLLGVITLNNSRMGRSFTEADREVLALFAAQAAIAIENSRLFQQEQERRRQVEAVQAVTEEITRELDLTAVLNLISRRAAELVRATSGGVILWDEGTQLLRPGAWHGVGDWVRELRLAMGQGITGCVAQQRKGMMVNDYQTWAPANPAFRDRTGAVAVLAEPLLYRDRLLGVITIQTSVSGQRFTEQDQQTVALFAAQAAIAIENARLFQEEQDRRRQVEAVRAIAEEITRELDLSAVLRLISQRAADLVRATSGGVILWDEATQLLTPASWHGVGDWVRELRWAMGEWIPGRVAQRRKGMIVNDYRTSPDANPAIRDRSDFVAGLVEPLLYRDRLLGVITVQTSVAGQRFTEQDQQTVALFAAQAAIAIENARLFEAMRAGRERQQTLSRRLVDIQETERRHIAHELHDEIGQLLTGLKLTLEMTGRRLAEADRAGLRRAQTLVDELVGRVRDLSLDLRPAMLDDLGLVPALVWAMERYTERTGVRVRFHHVGPDRRFPPAVETAAYRLVQEALTNVARHAGVQEAQVGLRITGDALEIAIEDAGTGFDPAAVLAAGASSGLPGMRERAVFLGGDFTIGSAPGAGTRVTARLPLPVPGGTENGRDDDRSGR